MKLTIIRNIAAIFLSSLFLSTCSDIFGEDPIYGCTDQSACNYDSIANTSDSSCLYLDDLLLDGYCDCDNNVLDECGECGGDGVDSDNDDICDDVDVCMGDYSDDGLYCSDMQVIQDFINQNSNLDSLVLNIGIQDWEDDNGRLTYLSLADLNLTSIPESIGDLDYLETLFLNNNNIIMVPETICNLNPSCEIFIQDNELCEEYRYNCLDHFDPQDCNE